MKAQPMYKFAQLYACHELFLKYTEFDYRGTYPLPRDECVDWWKKWKPSIQCPNTLIFYLFVLSLTHFISKYFVKKEEKWWSEETIMFTSWISLSKLSILSLFRLISESLVMSSNLKLEPSLSNWWVEVWYCSASIDKALYCSSKSDLSDSCQIENKQAFEN